MISWISCQHMQEYGKARWPLRSERTAEEWIKSHFLAETARALSSWSIAGRLLWIATLCQKIAKESPALEPAKIAVHLSENAEHYHMWTQYDVLRSTKVASEYYKALMGSAAGVNTDGSQELVREINRAAGPKVLDADVGQTSRETVSAAVLRMMADPEFVSDRTKLTTPPAIRVLSLGAGVQSTVMALMCNEGYMGMEKPDVAIFADTGWEPKKVYDHLKWLEEQLEYPVVRVKKSDLREDILNGKGHDGNDFISIPVFTEDTDEKAGVAKRQCTSNYKLAPIFAEVRKRMGVKKGKRAPKGTWAEMWLGITTDEAQRAKSSREECITNRYPLLERDLSRIQLQIWFEERYPGRELPRSACIGCPYRSDAEWKDLKDNEPESFDDAVFVDMALRQKPLSDRMEGRMFLSRHRIPLYQVDLDNAPSQSDLMQQECEGMCRV